MRLPLVLAAALAFAGCLPSSQRERTTALLPSDSLSRLAAQGVPVDTLALAWTVAGDGMSFPTSLVWTADAEAAGHLVVADTKRGSLHVFAPEGRYEGEVQPTEPALSYPYLAGGRGDTVVVLSRGERRLDWVDLRSRRIVRSVPIPFEDVSAALATAEGALWAKRTPEEGGGAASLVRLDGRAVVSVELPGPVWRRYGFLRAWGGALVSLSGYRPVADVLPPGGRLDTLALVGFDSPQFVRSHQFLRGEVDQPPLLTSSAFPLGDRLFVLNLRTDALRVDVYDRGGRLQRVLTCAIPEETRDHFPVDLAVRRGPSGYRLAVLMQRPGSVLKNPSGQIWMLRWDGA